MTPPPPKPHLLTQEELSRATIRQLLDALQVLNRALERRLRRAGDDADLTAILEAMHANAEDEATYKLLAATHAEDDGRRIEAGGTASRREIRKAMG